MLEVILKRFEQPDEIRTFEKGRFEVVRVGGMTIGRATYEPRMEMVGTRRARGRNKELRGGARRDGNFRVRDGLDG